MEITTLEKEVTILGIKALSFPEGAQAAHETLHSLVPLSFERMYVGLSFPRNTGMEYWAGTTELFDGELKKHQLESYLIPAGNYASIAVHDFMETIESIKLAFEDLLQVPNIIENPFGLEWYTNDNVCKCMIKLR